MQRKFLRRDRACVCGQRGGGKGKLYLEKLVERGRTPTLSVRIGSRTFKTGHLMKAVLRREWGKSKCKMIPSQLGRMLRQNWHR